MARLNPGGFAAGFESGFGMVSRAKKDKRDYELQQQKLQSDKEFRAQDQKNKDRTFGLSERTFGLSERNTDSLINQRIKQGEGEDARIKLSEKQLEIAQGNLDFQNLELPHKINLLEASKEKLTSDTEIAEINLEIKKLQVEVEREKLEFEKTNQEQEKLKTQGDIDANKALVDGRILDNEKKRFAEKTRNANLAQNFYQTIANGEIPLQAQFDELAGTQYDPANFIDPEYQKKLKFLTEAWKNASDPNHPTTLDDLAKNPEVLDALTIFANSEINMGTGNGIAGKNIASVTTVPKELQVNGGEVFIDLLVTRDDGSVYEAPATVGRGTDPNDPVHTVSMKNILDSMTGANVLVGMVKNLESSGKLEDLQRMAANQIKVGTQEKIKSDATKAAMKLWDERTIETRDLHKKTGVTKESYVLEQVDLAVKAAFNRPQSKNLGVSVLDLNERIGRAIDDHQSKRELTNDVPSPKDIPLSTKIEIYNIVVSGQNAGKEANQIRLDVLNKLKDIYEP